MTRNRSTPEDRVVLDAAVYAIIAERGRCRDSICRDVSPESLQPFPCHFRAVDGSLQRLRKAGRIVYRAGYWHTVEAAAALRNGVTQ